VTVNQRKKNGQRAAGSPSLSTETHRVGEPLRDESGMEYAGVVRSALADYDVPILNLAGSMSLTFLSSWN
jgi:hypothetical protein